MSAALSSNAPLVSPMTGFWRLVWKEYRSIRVFWLLLAAVSVLVQWTTAALWHNEPSAIALIYNFALGAPVFFAVACAGASFAAEREEGTIQFLRAAPISSGQVLASKLAIAAVGTVAMFIVVLPLARWFAQEQLPNDAEWRGMLGLWLVSAVEAVAWGTMFSLLGARPLVAVVLTLVAVSTCDHVLARMNKGPTPEIFEWLAYLRAAPWRGLVALVVFGADFYLGVNWLHGRPIVAKSPRAKRREATVIAELALVAPKDSVKQMQPLLGKRNRSAMFGHLLWQHWRQSRWLMLLMAILYVGLPFVGLGVWQQITTISRSYRVGLSGDEALLLPIAVLSTLIGAMVFLPDQEQRRYRFFAEHNVPPRLVWLARQLPWTVTLLLSTIIICATWLILFSDAQELLRAIGILTDPWGDYRQFYYRGHLRLPPIGLGIAVAAVGYAAGQFSSILVRSGILAGSFALVLNMVLFGWVLLMHSMQLSFLWSVLPIPLVLLWATWLRAPDWISENKRGRARGRVAATVFIPAAALLIAVPIYRVHQIPEVSPGFDVAQYEREIQANLTTGMATADLYGKASDLLSSPPIGLEVRQSSPTIDDQDQGWLTKNSASLKSLLDACSQQAPLFSDLRGPIDELRPFFKQEALIQLMILSARRLEVDGQLDAALDRYFAALRVASHCANPGGFIEVQANFPEVFQQLTYWGARSGQTRERIARAIKRLQAIDSRILQLDERLKADYLVARHAANGEYAALWFTSGIANLSSEILWLNFMPWERERAERLMNILTETALRRLDVMRATPMRLVYFCLPRSYPAAKGEFFEIPGETWLNLDIQRDEWLATTVPELWPMGLRGIDAARRLAWFETDRQATIIVLAIEAYRLDHGELPKSLDQLAGDYLDAVPKDPYSGEAFVYFPTGVTVSHQEIETYSYEMKSYAESKSRLESRFDAERSPPVNPDVPAIWSTGPDISISHRPRTQFDGATLNKGEQQSVLEYELRNGMSRSDRYLPIWMYGDWFGIPAKR